MFWSRADQDPQHWQESDGTPTHTIKLYCWITNAKKVLDSVKYYLCKTSSNFTRLDLTPIPIGHDDVRTECAVGDVRFISITHTQLM